jgi:hypothetical protein
MDVIIAGTASWVLSLFALRGFWKPATASQAAAHSALAQAAEGVS